MPVVLPFVCFIPISVGRRLNMLTLYMLLMFCWEVICSVGVAVD